MYKKDKTSWEKGSKMCQVKSFKRQIYSSFILIFRTDLTDGMTDPVTLKSNPDLSIESTTVSTPGHSVP